MLMKILNQIPLRKVRMSSRWEEYFGKKKKIDLRRLELVENRETPTKTVYYFRLKSGKLKSRQLSQ